MILMALFLLPGSEAFAGNLKAPIGFQNARVLPKGIRNLRVKGVYAQANNKFNNAGDTVPVANAMNKKISLSNFVSGQDHFYKQVDMNAWLKGQG